MLLLKMFPLHTLVILLCLQCGRICSAIHSPEMVSLQVEVGESATLPCNGSAYLEEEEKIHWEVMGEDVAILRGGELRQGEKYEGRVQLPSEEKLSEGDWSVVLQHATLSDSDMYECIIQGRRTISTVWLTVVVPPVEPNLVVSVGDTVELKCYVQISRNQYANDLQVWWTRNGNTILSTQESEIDTPLEANSEDIFRIRLLEDSEGEFHLSIGPTMMRDNGEYHCLYKTRDSDDPRPGSPETYILTVLETNPTDIVLHLDETSTAAEDWHQFESWTELVTHAETTGSPFHDLPVFLEDATEPIKEMIDSLEALEETATSFLDAGTPSGDSLQWDTLPWIRIGLITGVLLVTAVVLCILGALRKI